MGLTSEQFVYLATISPPYDRPRVMFGARKQRMAKSYILNYYMNEYENGGVDVDTTEVEWVGDESYAYLDGVRCRIEVREIEIVE